MSFTAAHERNKQFHKERRLQQGERRAAIHKTADLIYQLVFMGASQDEIDKQLEKLKALTRN